MEFRPACLLCLLCGWPLTKLKIEPAGGYRLLISICSRLIVGYPFASAAMSGSISARRSSRNSQHILRDIPSIKLVSLSDERRYVFSRREGTMLIGSHLRRKSAQQVLLGSSKQKSAVFTKKVCPSCRRTGESASEVLVNLPKGGRGDNIRVLRMGKTGSPMFPSLERGVRPETAVEGYSPDLGQVVIPVQHDQDG